MLYLAIRWSLQQRLFNRNESHPEFHNYTEVYSNGAYLLATSHGFNLSASYIFQSLTSSTSWSQQSQLFSYNPENDTSYYPNPENSSDHSAVRPALQYFSGPVLWGGTMIHRAKTELQMRTPYHNGSCIQLWLSDHFEDGWDTAVLTVRAPDLSNDTFHPHCDQVRSRFHQT